MVNPVHVDLIPRAIPTPSEPDPDTGNVEFEASVAWFARIGGVEFPVADYAVQQDGGNTMLSLVLAVTSLAVAEPSTVAEETADPAAAEAKQRYATVERLLARAQSASGVPA
jgi:hypothetical protein